jgi:hypothetical protein
MANLNKNLRLPSPVIDEETQTCQLWSAVSRLPQLGSPDYRGHDAMLTSQCSGNKGTGADPDVHYFMFPNLVNECQDMKGLVNKTGIAGAGHRTECYTADDSTSCYAAAFTTHDCNGENVMFPMPGIDEYWFNSSAPPCGTDASGGSYARLEWHGRGW